MHTRNEVRASVGSLLLVAVVTSASCGGGSDSEVDTAGGSGGKGGSSAGKGGSGGKGGSSAGKGGSSAGKGGTGNAGEAGDESTGEGGNPSAGATSAGESGSAGEAGGAATDCEARSSWSEAVHYVLSVTWAGTTASESGEGQVELWSRVNYSATGNELEVELRACGSMLPETNLTAAGRIATGGEKVMIEVPNSVWDAPSIPTTMTTGEHSGFGIGSTVEFGYVSQLGVTLDDPRAEWPDSGADLVTFDMEMDGAPGYTATPREGDGYVLPPTALGIVGSAPAADRVYLVSRQAVTLSGTRTACDAHSGTANVENFDNHVVGCHISGGDECNESQADFVDQNRMRYVVSSATYEAKLIAEDATCADVRAALPPQ
jgi:hypothetical protein